MKKLIWLLLIMGIFITGCGNNTAKNCVENYMKKYRTLNSEVLLDLEEMIKKENLTQEQEKKYLEIDD